MNTEIPFAPRRGIAAAIPDLHDRPRTEPRMGTAQPGPQPPISDAEAERLGRFAQALHDQQAPPAERTDLEQIALWIVHLTYADMKALAGGILDKDDQAETIVLADKLHAWASKQRVAS